MFVPVTGPPFEKVLLACAGMSSAGLESITCSKIGIGSGEGAGKVEVRLGDDLISVKSMHLVAIEDPMKLMSERLAQLFSETEV